MSLPSIGPDLLAAATDVDGHTRELRRVIHAEPEIGLDLPDTQAKILESLTGLGLDITTGEGCTSVVAELDSGNPGPTVLLRGDMDALPMPEDHEWEYQSRREGIMHACGHDGHVAMLASAARVLAENRSEISGTVRFMFQPGEEGYGGARIMVDEGVTAGVDRAYALHLISNMPSGRFYAKSGALMASADKFTVTVNGSGGHASMPHDCNDPIVAAAGMVTGIHAMVGRTMNVGEPGVITVAHIEAGTTNNVIPEVAFMEGTIRSVSETTRAKFHGLINQVTTNTAAAFGCTCSTHIEPGYPVTVNHEAHVDLAEAVAGGIFGDGHFVRLPTPVMGAEDFSYVLNEVPGAMVFLGAAPSDATDPFAAAPNHSNYMRINEDALARGVAMYVGMALQPS